jgi:hypothetical protein
MPHHFSFSQSTPLGQISGAVERHRVGAPRAFHVPYEGSNRLVKAVFPDGFFPAFGSGLAFKGQAEHGQLQFWCLTDRGPNGDGPGLPALDGSGTMGSKIFPAPGYAPSIGVLQAGSAGATLVACTPILTAAGVPSSGLPIPHGALGNSSEIPVFDEMRYDAAGKASFSLGGIDSEAIAYDRKRDLLWVSDEYGPFLMSIDPLSGVIRQRYAPGQGLPAVFALRRANRGMEGMTLDPDSDTIHAFLQSPLSDGRAHYALTGEQEKVERYARFARWIEFDPSSGATTRMLAYPLDASRYAEGHTGNAKLGDLVALGCGRFVVIEQGLGANGHIFNHLMLVDIGAATDIGAQRFNPATSDLEKSSMSGQPEHGASWGAVVPLTKVLLLDLNAIGWEAEKAEGLALVDARTLALTNDNDFGMTTRVFDAGGSERDKADVTAFEVDHQGVIVAGGDATDVIRVAPGSDQERPLWLWLLRFDQPLRSHGPA